MSEVFICRSENAASFDPQKAAAQLSALSRIRIGVDLGYCDSLGSSRGGIFPFADIDLAQMQRIVKNHGLVDFDVLAVSSFPRLDRPGAVVLDMDMTSVQIEGIDEIARRFKVYYAVADITAQAMRGEIDFATSLRRRVSMLRHCPARVLEEVRNAMPETAGLDLLMHCAAEASWKKGICSGGFVQIISKLEQKYHLDMVRANSFDIQNDELTGELDGAVVDAESKREGIIALRERFSLDPAQVVVLGDGANDLKMIEEAGLGIAYHAKPLVQERAPCALNHSDLSAVALLLRLASRREQAHL